MNYRLTLSFWKYVLGNLGRLTWRDRLTRVICRYRGHPYGVVWFNPGGDEPDYHCKNCWEDLK